MSPKRSRAARRPPAAKPAPRPKRSIVTPVVVLTLAVGAALWWRFGRHPQPPDTGGAPFDSRQTYAEAMTLSQQGRFIESLPMFRRVMESDTSLSQLHHDYATAMLNAVHQSRHHLGRQEFAVRSSIERVELVRWALVELVAAERTARDARARAWGIRTRAQALGAWGFPWEAMVGYRQVEWADPAWTEIAGRAERVLAEMEHPERANVAR
ncbi:MAG TPA: hypothetical protein VFQ05_15645 [Candidatus Eisenbacteria bacterium]|nr:hypothetical protein [Candidatus Eisenbacteria bacterium]